MKQLTDSQKQDALYITAFFLIWFIVFGICGSYTQGYDIYEHNLVITTKSGLDNAAFSETLLNSITNDMAGKHRFRPAYFLHLNTTISFLGADLTAHVITMVFLGFLTLCVLYSFAVSLGYAKLNSFLFSLATLAGPQMIIWSRFIDAENIAMLHFSLALLFMAKSVNRSGNRILNLSAFVFFLIISTLIKESFLLMIPATVFLFIYFYGVKNKMSSAASLKANAPVVILLFAYMSAVLFYITFSLGVDSQQYAGVSMSVQSVKNLETLFQDRYFSKLAFFTLISGMLLFIVRFLREESRSAVTAIRILKEGFFAPFVFLMLTAIPQLVLYMKTGFLDRYFLPLVLGFTFSLLFISDELFADETTNHRLRKAVYAVMSVLVAYGIIFVSVPNAKVFADHCRSVTSLANALAQSPSAGKVLMVMDPVQNFHEAYSLKIYLAHLNSAREFDYQFLERDYKHPYFKEFYADRAKYGSYMEGVRKELNISAPADSLRGVSPLQSIVIFGSLEQKFLQANRLWFSRDGVDRSSYGSYVLYAFR